jgi:hypothetical protein
MDVRWDIRREGRAWTDKEFRSRVDLRPEKLEVWEGKLLFSEEERLALLGLLLENVGADAAVKLGEPHVWVNAALSEPRSFLGDPLNRLMLVLVVLTPVIVVGAVWLITHLPVQRETVVTVLTSAAVALWVSAFVNTFLRD